MIKISSLILEIDIESHLKERGVDPERTQVVIDKKSNIATFLLYNLSGQLVGYQRYSPSEPKQRSNMGRYFTHITSEGNTKKIAVWGTETIKQSVPYLFIVEGIFDCVKIHNAGLPGVAVLGNNQKILKSWFSILNKKLIVIADNDEGGKLLRKFGHKSFVVPGPHKDLGEMPQAEATTWLKNILKEI